MPPPLLIYPRQRSTPTPYTYPTLLFHAFLVSAVLLSVPFLAYFSFLRWRRWRSSRQLRLAPGRVRGNSLGTGQGVLVVGYDSGVDTTRDIDPTNSKNRQDLESGLQEDLTLPNDNVNTNHGNGTLHVLTSTLRTILLRTGLTHTNKDTTAPTPINNHATLPLPAVQVRRIKIFRGRTLQDQAPGSVGSKMGSGLQWLSSIAGEFLEEKLVVIKNGSGGREFSRCAEGLRGGEESCRLLGNADGRERRQVRGGLRSVSLNADVDSRLGISGSTLRKRSLGVGFGDAGTGDGNLLRKCSANNIPRKISSRTIVHDAAGRMKENLVQWNSEIHPEKIKKAITKDQVDYTEGTITWGGTIAHRHASRTHERQHWWHKLAAGSRNQMKRQNQNTTLFDDFGGVIMGEVGNDISGNEGISRTLELRFVAPAPVGTMCVHSRSEMGGLQYFMRGAREDGGGEEDAKMSDDEGFEMVRWTTDGSCDEKVGRSGIARQGENQARDNWDWQIDWDRGIGGRFAFHGAGGADGTSESIRDSEDQRAMQRIAASPLTESYEQVSRGTEADVRVMISRNTAPSHITSSTSPSSLSSGGSSNPLPPLTRLKPGQEALMFQSPRPITPLSPWIPQYIDRPTRQLLLHRIFDPLLQRHRSLLVPPLSRLILHKWRKHRTALCREEPGEVEGYITSVDNPRNRRDRALRLRSLGVGDGTTGVDRTFSQQRRVSDPGVRRCVGQLWLDAMECARKEHPERGREAIVAMKRGMSLPYFPGWFSPGWESEEKEEEEEEEEKGYRVLYCDNEEQSELYASDEDVDIVLKYAGRERRQELKELLREFSEEMFLKELDARLDWWWWQTRGGTGEVSEREAERRTELLLAKEGRRQMIDNLEMEKEYFDKMFEAELKEGRKWSGGDPWRWIFDVPDGVRDPAAYCYPKPPDGHGPLYTVDGLTKKDRRPIATKLKLRYKHAINGLGRSGLGERMCERARRLVRGEEKMWWRRGQEEVRQAWIEFGGALSEEELFSDGPVDIPMVQNATANTDTNSASAEKPKCGSAVWTMFDSACSSASTQRILERQLHLGLDEAVPAVKGVTLNENITPAESIRSGGRGMAHMADLSGKGMTIVQRRRRRRRTICRAGGPDQRLRMGRMKSRLLRLAKSNISRSWGNESAMSGYVGGDEEDCRQDIVVSKEESESILDRVSNSIAAHSRAVSFGTDTTEVSTESGQSVQTVSSGFGDEWGWARLGIKGKRRDLKKALGNNDGPAPDGRQRESKRQISDSSDELGIEEAKEVELIPEKVRGTWGRDGGYMKMASEPTTRSFKKEGEVELETMEEVIILQQVNLQVRNSGADVKFRQKKRRGRIRLSFSPLIATEEKMDDSYDGEETCVKLKGENTELAIPPSTNIASSPLHHPQQNCIHGS